MSWFTKFRGQDRIAELEAEVMRWRESAARDARDLDAFRDQIHKISEERDEVSRELVEAQKELIHLKEFQKITQSIEAQLTECEKSASSKDETIDKLTSHLRELSQESIERAEKIEEIEAELARSAGQAATLAQENAELKREIEVLRAPLFNMPKVDQPRAQPKQGRKKKQ